MLTTLPRAASILILAFVVARAAFSEKLTAPTDARAKVDKIFERYNHTDSPGCVAGWDMRFRKVR